MDPFEARLLFSKMLLGLLPSIQVLSKCSAFALRNYEYQDDFHSCVIEVLPTLDLNLRLNMLSFLDTLIGQSKVSFAKNSKVPYIDNIVTDLPKIVALVVPANEYGLYNLRICFDILRTISVQLGLEEPLIENFEKQFESDLLTDELKASVDQIEKSQTSLDEKIDLGFVFQTKDQEFIAKGGVESAWEILINRKLQSQFISYRDYFVGSGHKESPPAPLRLSKEQILARMEADRERHKRAKEGLWRVDRQKTGKFDKSEFSKLWNQFGALTEEEYKELRELNEVSRLSYNF